MMSNMTEKTDGVVTDVQNNVRALPITSLVLVGLAGVGVMSIVHGFSKLFCSTNCNYTQR